MSAAVSVVLAAPPTRALALQALRELQAQTLPPLEVLVVDAGTTWAPGLPREAAAAGLALVVVDAPRGSSPGAARNAGVRRARGPLVACLDPGWSLDPRYLERVSDALALEPRAPVAASRAAWDLWGDRDLAALPAACDLAALMDRDLVPPCAAFRRDSWERAGGFDEALRDAVEWDLWLRLVLQDGPALLLDEPLVTLRASARPQLRGELSRHARVPALTAVFEKHRALFERHAADALLAREVGVRTQDGRVEALARRVAALGEELAELEARGRALRAELAASGEDVAALVPLPVSRSWGCERPGGAVDRRLIEAFLRAHAGDIRGRVLEVQGDEYARAFGGARVAHVDVLDLDASNPRATIVADLRAAAGVPSDAFDCLIVTQTLHVIDDLEAALGECLRLLAPGGVLLATLPAVSRRVLEYGREADLWRLTSGGARFLLERHVAPADVQVASYGNVRTSAAFLEGRGRDEVADEDYAFHDPYNPTVIGVRAVKRARGEAPRARTRRAGAVLGYHRIGVGPDVHGLRVPAARLRAHLEALRAGFRVLPLEQLVLAAEADDLPERAVALTFDDGYPELLQVLAPLLRELELPATVFVTTAPLEERRPFWWDALEAVLLGERPLPARLEVTLREERLALPTHDAASRRAAHDRLHPLLVRAGPAERDDVMRQVARAAPGPLGLDLPLAADGVRALAGVPGVTIGAHGVHHLALAGLPLELAQPEVFECKLALERLLGRAVTSFCYPYGSVDAEAASLARAAGYRVAVTKEPGLARAGTSALRVPRLEAPRACDDLEAWLAPRLEAQ